MQVEQVDFVTVPTQDVERAVAWYRDVLGLPVSEYTDGEFLGETYDSGVCLMGFLKDPDGNTVILHRRYKPHG